MTIKQGIRLSAIIDKMGVKLGDPEAGASRMGADLMVQLVAKAHLAEQEIYAFVADVKGISAEEAERVNLVEFAKEIASNPAIVDFFKPAAS